MDMKTTNELVNEIKETSDILDYLEKNNREMQVGSLPEYLNSWLEKKGRSKADVIRGSNLNRAYVYQIFLGLKYPSRDKIIALAFGLGLDADEVQSLLKQPVTGSCTPETPGMLFSYTPSAKGKRFWRPTNCFLTIISKFWNSNCRRSVMDRRQFFKTGAYQRYSFYIQLRSPERTYPAGHHILLGGSLSRFRLP